MVSGYGKAVENTQVNERRTECLVMAGNKTLKRSKYIVGISYNNYIRVRAILSTMMGFSLQEFFKMMHRKMIVYIETLLTIIMASIYNIIDSQLIK